MPLSGSLAPGAYLVVPVDPQNGSPDGVALYDTVAPGRASTRSPTKGRSSARSSGRSRTRSSRATPLPAAVADSNTVTGSLARIPNGSDTNDSATDWAFTTTVTPGRRQCPLVLAAPLRAHVRAPLRAGLGPALPLLGLESLVEPPFEVGQLALQLVVALPAVVRQRPVLERRLDRRSPARCRGRNPRSGTGSRAPRRRRTSPRGRPTTPRAAARAARACPRRARRPGAGRAGGAGSCGGPRRRARGSSASPAAPRRRACSRASTCRPRRSRAARSSGPAARWERIRSRPSPVRLEIAWTGTPNAIASTSSTCSA